MANLEDYAQQLGRITPRCAVNVLLNFDKVVAFYEAKKNVKMTPEERTAAQVVLRDVCLLDCVKEGKP